MAIMTIVDDIDEDIDQDDEFSPDQEESVNNFVSNFVPNSKEVAKRWIEFFFQDKMLYCGGNIPKSLLLTNHHISMVMNFSILSSLDYAYEALEKTLSAKEINKCAQTGESTSDIKLVNETLKLIAGFGVPKPFAGGSLIL